MSLRGSDPAGVWPPSSALTWLCLLGAVNVAVLVDVYVFDQRAIGSFTFLPAEWWAVQPHDGPSNYKAGKSTLLFALATAQLSLFFLWVSVGRSFWLTRWLLALSGAAVCTSAITHVRKVMREWLNQDPWIVYFCFFLAIASMLGGALLRLLGYRLTCQEAEGARHPTVLRFRIRDLLVVTFAIAVLFAANPGELVRVMAGLPGVLRNERWAVKGYSSMRPSEIYWLLAHAVVYANILAVCAWSMLTIRRGRWTVLLGLVVCAEAVLMIGAVRHYQRYVLLRPPPHSLQSWGALNCFILFALVLAMILLIVRRIGYRFDRDTAGIAAWILRWFPQQRKIRVARMVSAVILTLAALGALAWQPLVEHFAFVRAVNSAKELGRVGRRGFSDELLVFVRRPLTAEVVERLNEHSQITHLLWAAETDTREEDFDHLRQLRHVHSVGLRGSEHSRESLAKLVEMPSLRHLTLFSGDLDQGDVQELAKSSSLREIHVNPEASMMPGATTTRPPSSSVQISPQSLQLP